MEATIDSIQGRVWELASKIEAPRSLTTVFSVSPQDGRPHVEVIGDEFLLVSEERGLVSHKKGTKSIDELLYWIFLSITSKMAQEYELHHRDEDRDSRRIMFDRQLELMEILSSEWCCLLKAEIESTLTASPYLDRYMPTASPI